MDFGTVAIRIHGAALLCALAALYKFGDRTDVVAKSLEGTKGALDSLRAYMARSLSVDIAPLIQDLVEARSHGEELIEALGSDQFQDAISNYVNRDADEMVVYRQLCHARKRWSIWARRLSWSILVFVVVEAVLSCYFLVLSTIVGAPIGKISFGVGLGLSAAIFLHSSFCFGTMLYYHDKISTYREKIL